MVPALQLHHDVMVILDKPPAVKLRHEKYYRRVLDMTPGSRRSDWGEVYEHSCRRQE